MRLFLFTGLLGTVVAMNLIQPVTNSHEAHLVICSFLYGGFSVACLGIGWLDIFGYNTSVK